MTISIEARTHLLRFGRLFVASGLQAAAFSIAFALIAPGMFSREVALPWALVGWSLGLGIPLSLFEYLYHRYLLHSAVLPFMGAMHVAHGVHHGLTSVKAPVQPSEPAKLVTVKSEFPIEEEHQEDSMMFPFWSLSIFLAVFLLIMALPLKAMFFGQPLVLATIFSVTLYYCSYEVWHAVLHFSYDRFWQPLTKRGWMGKLVSRIYGFHLMHHWRPSSNLAIVGLWGFAVWDHLFRTYRLPQRLPHDRAEVNYYDAKLKRPLFPISMFDRWQPPMVKASRAFERFLGRIFLRRRNP